MKKTVLSTILSALLVAIVAAPASAQTYYLAQDTNWFATNDASNSEAAELSFLSALTTDVGTETFDSFTDGNVPPLPLDFGIAGSATLLGTGVVEDEVANGRRGYSTDNFWEISTSDDGNAGFRIEFSEAIAAFGFFGIDVGDFGAQLNLDFYRNGSLVDTWTPVHGLGASPVGSPAQLAQEGNLNYFGYINTGNPFDEVRFSSTGVTGVDVWGFDNMTIATREQVVTTVPEPATMTLLATGLAAMAGASKRRRNRNKTS